MEKNVSSNFTAKKEHIHQVDDIKNLLDYRYISASEACWRIHYFNILCRDPNIERLIFHLQDEQSITFRDSESLNQLMNRIHVRKRQCSHNWMGSNKLYDDAWELIYGFSNKVGVAWIWQSQGENQEMYRSHFCCPSNGWRKLLPSKSLYTPKEELKPLKILELLIVFLNSTFKEPCSALGLEALTESSLWATGKQFHELSCQPLELWCNHLQSLSDDIQNKKTHILHNPNLELMILNCKIMPYVRLKNN